jgi:hypothetical protein
MLVAFGDGSIEPEVMKTASNSLAPENANSTPMPDPIRTEEVGGRCSDSVGDQAAGYFDGV